MHEPRTLAALLRSPVRPLCDWLASPLDDPGTPLGCMASGNLLRPDFAFDAMLPGEWIFAWSGTLGEDLETLTPMNWMRGPALLNEACASLGPQLVRHRRRLLLVPHARHVLNDARSTLEWWCRHVIPGQEFHADTRAPEGERPFGLALDPLALLEPEMLADAADHLRALFSALGPRVDAVILRGAPPVGERTGEPVPLTEGVLPVELLRALLAQHVALQTPVLVPASGLGATKQALGMPE